jgi:hypothetical protein
MLRTTLIISLLTASSPLLSQNIGESEIPDAKSSWNDVDFSKYIPLYAIRGATMYCYESSRLTLTQRIEMRFLSEVWVDRFKAMNIPSDYDLFVNAAREYFQIESDPEFSECIEALAPYLPLK